MAPDAVAVVADRFVPDHRDGVAGQEEPIDDITILRRRESSAGAEVGVEPADLLDRRPIKLPGLNRIDQPANIEIRIRSCHVILCI